jgi:hypothetical protein
MSFLAAITILFMLMLLILSVYYVTTTIPTVANIMISIKGNTTTTIYYWVTKCPIVGAVFVALVEKKQSLLSHYFARIKLDCFTNHQSSVLLSLLLPPGRY